MTRGLFITRLRQGLTGLPEEEINEIITDYQAHFSDALAADRYRADARAAEISQWEELTSGTDFGDR